MQIGGTLLVISDKKAHLIILDDFGLQPISQQVKLALLQIIEDRYENASTIFCSQLPVSKWHEYFEEPTIAAHLTRQNHSQSTSNRTQRKQ